MELKKQILRIVEAIFFGSLQNDKIQYLNTSREKAKAVVVSKATKEE